MDINPSKAFMPSSASDMFLQPLLKESEPPELPQRKILVKGPDGSVKCVEAREAPDIYETVPVNIVVIGLRGSGKSSFINNIFTLLQSNPMERNINPDVPAETQDTICRHYNMGHQDLYQYLTMSEAPVNEAYMNHEIACLPLKVPHELIRKHDAFHIVPQEDISIEDIRESFLQIYEKRLSTEDKMRKLTESLNGGDANDSIINRIFQSFKQFTGQTKKLDFEMRDIDFENWKHAHNLDNLKVSVHTFKRIEKKLYLYSDLHNYASRGMITNRDEVEHWERIRIKLNESISLRKTDGNRKFIQNEDQNSMKVISEGTTLSGNTNFMEVKSIEQIFLLFHKLHNKQRSNFKNRIQELTKPLIGTDPDSSIIFRIITSYKNWTNQDKHSKDFNIHPKEFEEWKARMTPTNLKPLNVNHRTFRKVYKKLYLYPSLWYLASRGMVDTTRHVEAWQRIQKHLPENLDSIESSEAIHIIEENYSRASSKKVHPYVDMEIENNRNELRSNIPTGGVLIPQVVILLLSFEIIQNPEIMEMMKQQLQNFQKLGYQPLIVVSKADEGENEDIAKKIRERPLDLFTLAPHKKEKMNNLLNIFCVAEKDVYHMVSYTDEKERIDGIDKLTSMVLNEALKRAEEFRLSSDCKSSSKTPTYHDNPQQHSPSSNYLPNLDL